VASILQHGYSNWILQHTCSCMYCMAQQLCHKLQYMLLCINARIKGVRIRGSEATHAPHSEATHAPHSEATHAPHSKAAHAPDG
jgi:hypothetical protein